MDSPLEEFLKRNSVGSAEGTHPLVHTTQSFKLRDIISSAGLSPSQCEVFDESLLYFFVGRPAYKWSKSDGSPRDWELPSCFVFDDLPNLDFARAYPFDSGAHHNGRYPSYVQAIERKKFECKTPESSRRLISAFYGSFPNYVSGKPKSKEKFSDEFSLSPLDAEVLAIQELAHDGSVPQADDRRFSIEIQAASSVSFSEVRPSAVILPTPYLKDENVINALNAWESEVLNYDMYSLSIDSYFGAVFLKFTEYLKQKKLLP